ncbi:MAG: Fic family protein [Lachnospiraceae bacterium]|nr:Fic family protein [Lachnospiraceae bacterium]
MLSQISKILQDTNTYWGKILMNKVLDIRIEEALRAYLASGVEEQVDYQKFYLYSIVTHSTAIEGSTITEIENQLLFDEGIAAKNRSLKEQMMNVDLKDAYLHAFRIASENPTYTPEMLRQLSAHVMRRTGSEYSTIAGQFDSSKGDFRLCNVSAGIGGRSYLAYNKVESAVADFCKWLNDEIATVDKKDIAACYRLSFEAHFRLVTIHPWVDGNGRTTRLVMNMIQRQLGLVPSIDRKEDKGEYIQSLVDSRENEDSTIAQDTMLRHHIANLNRRVAEYQHTEGTSKSASSQSATIVISKSNICTLDCTLEETAVLRCIKTNPKMTQIEMAAAIGKSERTVKTITSALVEKCILTRQNGRRNGWWEINKEISEL